jgi:hypothetical protein
MAAAGEHLVTTTRADLDGTRRCNPAGQPDLAACGGANVGAPRECANLGQLAA